MRAVVLGRPGGPENLVLSTLPLPQPPQGWVRIAVRAFGLNRSELHTRLGLSEAVRFPRVLGIEAVGVIDELPGGDDGDPARSLIRGQQVATMLGGMGRVFDGGYAEYLVVPRRKVIPFTSALPLAVLGAVPETLQTAYGSLMLQAYLDRLAAGSLSIGPLHTYTLDDLPRAHADLAHNRVFGKLVGVIDPADAAVTR